MQKFFSNRKLIIVMIAIIISMGLMAFSVSVRNSEKTPPLVQRFGNDVVGVVDRVVALPANGVKSSFGAVSNLINTYEENTKLKAQLDDLAQTKTRAQTLQSENKELKKQLKLDKTLTDYSQLNAAVLTRSPANWQNNLVINKGSLAGIKKNMPVMAGSGLIGRIVEVNGTNSKVELITTDNQSANRFAAEVITSDGTANGIITGYDQATSELKMGQLNSDAKIKVGDTVQTSGLGGLTPRGLYIGKVTKIKHDDYGLALSLEIKPAVDLDDFTVVTVIERQIAGD
ncbi:rod shape-determining protein MreC [Loigolactobacillus jiayinensis]|uniref:Cell shape-determining protein MreC n=1 Tax=Loigolactobacillus jiayinensis TaxID=2486016 RepID=A0ABW1RGG3_9LACO|nr:rod shape-determining protein MreC [Loigolactobacillus jiayinensis]